MKKYFSDSGLTIVELLIAMAIFSILIAIPTISLVNVKHKTSVTSVVNTFIADLKEQQLKAMVGDTEGRGTTDNYGIHFTSTSYVLFHGTYSAVEPTNFTVSLSDTAQFNPIPSDLIFTKGSGEIGGTATITIKDSVDNNQHAITLNRYGVITGE